MKKTVTILGSIVVMAMFVGQAWGFTESSCNNFFGSGAGLSITSGGCDVFIGGNAGRSNTTGSSNTFIGNAAGLLNTTGSDNTLLGDLAGTNNTTGSGNSFLGNQAGLLNTTGSDNTLLGDLAGTNNTTGSNNNFFGWSAGFSNTTGSDNSFLGWSAGFSNTTGSANNFLGWSAGYSNTTGIENTSIGYQAGYSNSTGNSNVFLGFSAGYSETGSNRLYIDNCLTGLCTTPLIYGEFDTGSVRINAPGVGVAGYPAYTLDVSNLNVNKSALHFSLNGTDTGGWITSVSDNNFWLSSGAMWDATAGGWVQKSPDGLAVMAGSGPSGYRVITRSGCAVGTVCTPTTRMTIDYSGNVGFGVTPTQPLQMASGAFVTVGGAWTNASSRQYKENIRDITAEEAIQTLEGLNPVAYNYKAAVDERHVGFIAEDVPELVATKDRKGLSAMDIVAVLTKVVKEKSQMLEKHQQTIEAQQKALEAVEAKLAEVEAEMLRLRSMNISASLSAQN